MSGRVAIMMLACACGPGATTGGGSQGPGGPSPGSPSGLPSEDSILRAVAAIGDASLDPSVDVGCPDSDVASYLTTLDDAGMDLEEGDTFDKKAFCLEEEKAPYLLPGADGWICVVKVEYKDAQGRAPWSGALVFEIDRESGQAVPGRFGCPD